MSGGKSPEVPSSTRSWKACSLAGMKPSQMRWQRRCGETGFFKWRGEVGAPVDELSDLRDLDLQVIDKICPSLNIRYAAASAATGAGSGFVAGGGTAAIIGTGGVGAAPGGLAVGVALAADVVAAQRSLWPRVVTHYAGYYGYDARQEEEKAVILAVIGVGVVGEGAAKQAAMLHVRQVAMMVARRAAWKELGEEVIVKLVQSLFGEAEREPDQEEACAGAAGCRDRNRCRFQLHADAEGRNRGTSSLTVSASSSRSTSLTPGDPP